MVDKLLEGHSNYAAAYIDDVIIYSNSWEEHLTHLRAVLQEIESAGLKVNPEKCKFRGTPNPILGVYRWRG